MSSVIKSKVIGIDIGYKTTTIAVVNIRGTILALDSFPTSSYPQINSFVEQICERMVKLAEANGGYENIRSVGVTAASANF